MTLLEDREHVKPKCYRELVSCWAIVARYRFSFHHNLVII